MKIYLLPVFCASMAIFNWMPGGMQAQQLFTSNEALSASQLMQPRPLNYWPEGDAIVCVNGKNRFTRALYGGSSAFRLETSDYPEFGLFMPYMGGNILIDEIRVSGKHGDSIDSLLLSSGEVDVIARYENGCRIYEFELPRRFRKVPAESAIIRICASALEKCDAAVFEIESCANVRTGVELVVRYGAADNASFSRNGDMGVDRKDCFDFSLARCRDNVYRIEGETFHLDYGQKSKKGPREMCGIFSKDTRLEIVQAKLESGNPVDYLKAHILLSSEDSKSTVRHFLLGHPSEVALLLESSQGPKARKNGKNTDGNVFPVQIKDLGDQWLGKIVEDGIQAAEKKSQTVIIETPDPVMNTLGASLSMAADGIWGSDGVWQHGAIGWRMPLPGWRAAYTGDVMGWHDRARVHFNNYAASQLTDVAVDPTLPIMDSSKNLARGLEKIGTPMYSDGYICRFPNNTKKVNHYDMNLVYIDELLWHFNWTGDWAYVYEMWPVLRRHLDWEKRNFDPDNDCLYDAYCCIWASDGLYYSGGAVTHSSAYNHRANAMASMIARHFAETGSYEKNGKKIVLNREEIASFKSAAEKYGKEAQGILSALNRRLWMEREGVWAESQDALGLKRLHRRPALWTVYHAIDSDVATPQQADRAMSYVDAYIPHIPIRVDSEKNPVSSSVSKMNPAIATGAQSLLEDILSGGYATVATTSWQPYGWSINNVAHAEVAHTALAYWQAGRNDDGYRLFKSIILDAMFLGASPGNFGQISFYDAARSECYRDFGDPVGIISRTIVQGLFGIRPDRLNRRIHIVPGFPSDWEHARIATTDYEFSMQKHSGGSSLITDWIYQNAGGFETDTLILTVKAEHTGVKAVKVNGKALAGKYGSWRMTEDGAGNPILEMKIDMKSTARKNKRASDYQTSYAIQTIWEGAKYERPATSSRLDVVKDELGNLRMGDFSGVDTMRLEPIDLSDYYNLDVKHLFHQQYLSPRWAYTTLALPTQGIGEWCHPADSFHVDDTGIRSVSVAGNGILKTSLSVPFRLQPNREDQNALFTSRWDNYPTSVTLPLHGQASHLYLMMVGTTNAMQCRIENGVIRVNYTDGSCDSLMLVNPATWWPIDQDFLQGLPAFYLHQPGGDDMPAPYRIHLRTAEVYKPKAVKLNQKTDGGAATLLDLLLDERKTLRSVQIETLSNDVIIGLMGLTLQR